MAKKDMTVEKYRRGWEVQMLRRTFPGLSLTDAEELAYAIKHRHTTFPNTSNSNPYWRQFEKFVEKYKHLPLEAFQALAKN